jgi:hypothetical protein
MGVDVGYSIRIINSGHKEIKTIGINSFGAANANPFDSLFYGNTEIQNTSIPLNLNAILTEEEIDIFRLYADEEAEELLGEMLDDMTSVSKVMSANTALTILEKIELSIRDNSINCLLKDIKNVDSSYVESDEKLEAQKFIVIDYYSLKSDVSYVCGILGLAKVMNCDIQFIAEYF